MLAASALSRIYAPLAPNAPAISVPEVPARQSSDPIAAEAMQLCTQMLGRYTGDAVLMTGARGGLYLASDALQTWGSALNASLFYESFLEKGQFRPYIEQVPVNLITAPNPAFTGLSALLSPAVPEAGPGAAAPGRLA